ncbi:MAG TPA: Gfo/Idh/MocA family oxidoreductase [Bryobacteraceae bacterium]|nr:Gfo/Idh/MocA family oxidoreductase [Bryobacteraceae bacterium]
MKDVDAVIIATPDSTHARILADAVAAGKDVYVEKPFVVDFQAGKMAWGAVKRSKQVVQVGTQRRSTPEFIGAAKAIHAGVDWEALQFGGRIKGPFDARKLREWQLFRDTTSGMAGLWMCHLVDLAPWYLQDPFPKQAVTLGDAYLWKDGRQTSDVFQSLAPSRYLPGMAGGGSRASNLRSLDEDDGPRSTRWIAGCECG